MIQPEINWARDRVARAQLKGEEEVVKILFAATP